MKICVCYDSILNGFVVRFNCCLTLVLGLFCGLVFLCFVCSVGLSLLFLLDFRLLFVCLWFGCDFVIVDLLYLRLVWVYCLLFCFGALV